MGRTVKLGRVFAAAGMVGLLANVTYAASDKALEERVRALEQKMSKPAAAPASDVEHKALGERISAVEKDVIAAKDAAAAKLGIDVHGFVATSYNYNFNSPDSGLNKGRVFDTDANTFALDSGTLQLSHTPEESGPGFGMSLDFGKFGEVVGSVSHWSHSSTSSESSNSFEMREAYLTYKLAVGDGITLKAGRFVTLLGAEIIDNWNAHNSNISRSFSFGYGIPFTHTGLIANIPVAGIVSFDVGVVNGWDDVVDQNSGKTLLAGIGFTPADVFSLYVSGTYGAEQANRGGSKRGVTTAVATIKPVDMLSLVFEGTYGNESDFAGNGTDSVDWYGGAGYVNVQASDDLSFALRGEVFDDPDGVRGLNATVTEFTPTVSYNLSAGLLVRAEYRHDEADKKIFDREAHAAKSQDTIATQVVYSF